MAKFSPIVHMPRYLAEFKCIGPACPETCCSGWRVTIDKHTFKQYKAIAIEPLKSKVATTLLRTDSQDAANWGSLQMDARGDCGFLDAEHLCSVQTHLGPQALSETCRHYPRSFQQLEDERRVYATLSCPEAARLALADPASLDLQAVTLSEFTNPGELPKGIQWRDQTEPPRVSFLAGRVLQDLLVGLLENPKHSAFDALALGLMLIRKLNSLTNAVLNEPASNDRREDVMARLHDVFELFTQDEYLAANLAHINALDAQHAFQVRLLRGVTKEVSERHLTASACEAIGSAVEGLGIKDQAGDDALQAIAELKAGRWQEWENQHPHILKNYLINSIQSRLLGRHFGSPQELEDAYLDVVIRTALIRFWLMGQLAKYGPAFCQDHVVKTIYSLARSIEHDNKFMPRVLELMAAQGIRNLATAMVLLR